MLTSAANDLQFNLGLLYMRGILNLNGPSYVYICNCNAIRERDVRHAIDCGAATPKAVFAHCGARPQCAKCVCEMREMIDEQQQIRSIAAE